MAIPDKPESRAEMYLNKIASGSGTIPAQPESRLEQYLDAIANNGGGGSGGGSGGGYLNRTINITICCVQGAAGDDVSCEVYCADNPNSSDDEIRTAFFMSQAKTAIKYNWMSDSAELSPGDTQTWSLLMVSADSCVSVAETGNWSNPKAVTGDAEVIASEQGGYFVKVHGDCEITYETVQYA
jgi:hypothetical protein